MYASRRAISWEAPPFFFFSSFCSLGPHPAASGSSPARGRIGATAAGLHHSHSNTGSLTHWVRPGIEPAPSWLLVQFISPAPQQELQEAPSFLKELSAGEKCSCHEIGVSISSPSTGFSVWHLLLLVLPLVDFGRRLRHGRSARAVRR